MNTIELKSEIRTSESDDFIYLVGAIFIDGEALVNFQSYAASLSELKQSLEDTGTYFVLTCWCGEPTCAGISKGVKVVHNKKTTEWTIFQPQPQRTFTFGSIDYERAIIDGIEQIKRDVANVWFTSEGIKNEKLEIVPGTEEDMALLEPKARTKLRNHHRNA